ncbi:hypothetical protein BIY23_00575 [Wolbachia pipientis]|uniref:Uncharacterized protein n=1 Tax=Wolbachia pipientis TaxID=955 RepID=A0A1E7QKI2_WOLPI|nr:ankyrin repeat domain-containing protein [Wolbachia pipientis]OEY86982.1 hypothetical protein BIY23_00575 [Wolbachia pipientis]
MKNLYLILFLTMSISYNVSTAEEQSSGKQEIAEPSSYLPYTTIEAKDGKNKNKEVIAQVKEAEDQGKEIKDKDTWTENNVQKEDKKIYKANNEDNKEDNKIDNDLKILDEKLDKTITVQHDISDENINPNEQTRKVEGQKPVVDREKPTNKEARITNKENKKLKSWVDLKKEPVRKWPYQETQDKPIHKRQYDDMNMHLPTTAYVHDYSKQLFYCVGKDDILCMRGIINKFENIGFSIKEILDLRNSMGDTPLIYAARRGVLNVVRFLLLQGADVNAVNTKFESALDITNKKDIINAINEMKSGKIEVKKVSNKKDSDLYNWAISAKENNESWCGKK